MSNQNIIISDENKPPLNDLSTQDFDGAILKFTKAIDTQYFSLENEAHRVIFNGVLREEELTDSLKSALSRTNYDIAALQGESVVLFNKPYLVSAIYCESNSHTTKKANIIRLLTNIFADKKIIPLSHQTPRQLGNRGGESVYMVSEVIWGLILPRGVIFKFARVIDLESFFNDEQKISEITTAHKSISFAADALKLAMEEQKSEVSSYLNEKSKDYDLIKQELNSILKEKERVEKSIANENITLDRIRSDIESETKELDTAQGKKDAYSDKAEELRLEINDNRDKLKSEKTALNEVNNLISGSKSELSDLREQITKIKADINVTTLDMKGFTSESQSQASRYFWLALTTIGFLAIIFACMYDNAKTFADLIDANPTVSTWNILLSRLPLITATTLILGTLSALLFYLVNNIISVSETKMNMLKASVLAEQITGSLPKSGMTDEEVRDYKRNTKIELVMNLFTKKPEDIKDNKQTNAIKEAIEIIKSLK